MCYSLKLVYVKTAVKYSNIQMNQMLLKRSSESLQKFCIDAIF